MAVIKKFIHVIAVILYVCVGVYALLCAPMVFGYKPLVVLSGSMEPTYKVGGIVYYKTVNPFEIKQGDIITFKADEKTIVSHRVMEVHESTFVTKGDANNSIDPNEVSYANVLGRDLELCIPYLGYYVRFINENMLVCIPVVIILALEFLLSNKDFSKKSDIERREEDGRGEITETQQ